jgi:hypothetical protein
MENEIKKISPIDILIDFDGTCVTHSFPNIGKDIGSVPVLKKLIANGHKLILFTMRSDSQFLSFMGNKRDTLKEAVEWFKNNDITLYGIQENPTQKTWTSSPKCYGDLMIDDSALGCPLKYDSNLSNRPFVDWVKVEEMLIENGIIKQ